MKRKLYIFALLAAALIAVLAFAAHAEDTLPTVEGAWGCDTSVTLPTTVGTYTANEAVATVKSGTLAPGATVLFSCRDNLAPGTYDLVYKNGTPAVALCVRELGDVNADGKINTRDVVLLKQSVVGMATLTDTQKKYADALDDGTGKVNTMDAVKILQFIVGMTPAVDARPTVSFFDENGGLYAAFTVPSGGDFTALPPIPEAWKRAGYEGAWDIPTGALTNVTSAVTVRYAAKTLTYTVTYHLDGGTNADNPTSYTAKSPSAILKDAAKDGYTFVGWYSDPSFEHQVTEIRTGSTGNMDLYARFTPDVHTHSYSAWTYADELTHTRTCACGNTQTEYHSLDEGKTEDNGDTVYTCTVCGHPFIVIAEYSVIFTGDKDVVLEAITFERGTSVPVTPPADPAVSGKRFVKWDRDPESVQTEELTDDLYIRAVFTPEYLIAFYDEEGKQIGDVIRYAPEEDNVPQYPTVAEKEGYTHKWDISLSDLKKIQKNTVVNLSYERNVCHVVFYDYDNTLLKSEDVLYNLTATAPKDATEWYFDFKTRTGYQMAGWELKKKNGESLKIPLSEFEKTGDRIIKNIKENLNCYPYYEKGCMQPTVVVKRVSDTELNFSVLIPKDYFVHAVSIKFLYELPNNEKPSEFIYVDDKGVSTVSAVVGKTGTYMFEVNERGNYFTYIYTDIAGQLIELDESYNIFNVKMERNNNVLYDFSEKNLSDIFVLDTKESQIVYHVGDGSAQAQPLAVIFEKGN